MTKQIENQNKRTLMEKIYNSLKYKSGMILSFPQNGNRGYIQLDYLDSIDFQYNIMIEVIIFNKDKAIDEKVFFTIKPFENKIRLEF